MVHLTSLVVLALASFAAAGPIVRRAPAGTAIPGQYVITFKKSTGFAPRNLDALIGDLLGAPHTTEGGVAARADAASPGLLHKYDFGPSFQGFAASIKDDAVLARIKANSQVEAIEEDQVISLAGTQPGLPTGLWGLDAIDGKVDRTFTYPDAAGAGVDAYVIDTGCNIAHSEFSGGRAKWGASFTGESSKTDGNGHGTHVAGTIGGKTYGVAKKASIICVRVLDAQGSGATSGVVAGINWVASNARSTGRKSVANMSLGGGKSTAIDNAAKALASTVALAVAAGNDETMDACDGSPSGASGVLTVAASDKSNYFADFSSWGSCVEVIAPGVDILSAWKGSSSSTNTISGTSMATPHVVGVLALAFSTQSVSTPAQAVSYVTSRAKKNAIRGDLSGTPNRFLQI